MKPFDPSDILSRKDDRGTVNRTGQGAASGFIYAANPVVQIGHHDRYCTPYNVDGAVFVKLK